MINRKSISVFQSTPPVKAATWQADYIKFSALISIHAAREGGDFTVAVNYVFSWVISIHAAREGGDAAIARGSGKYIRFQSTPPVKAAT